jgi:hypothetical protein
MKTKMTLVYECKQCGTEITVNSAGLKSVDPIYCCGLPLKERKKATAKAAITKKQMARSEKKSVKNEVLRISRIGAVKRSKNKEVS